VRRATTDATYPIANLDHRDQQRRQGTAGAEPVPAGHARPPVDRVAEPAQAVHVVADGARWTEFQRGRHFPAMEAPAQLAADLHAFFGPLR
jgi:hypothetical protein